MFKDTAREFSFEIDWKNEPKKPDTFFKPEWWDNQSEGSNYEKRCRDVVKAFVNGTLKNAQPMRHTNMNGRHVYSTKNNGTELWMFKNNESIKVSICIARKVNEFYVGNSSSLMFMRPAPTKKNPGKQRIRAVSSTRLKIQEVLSEVMPMVPFALFKESQMDINTLRIIEKGPDEHLDLGREVKGKKVLTHFTGAILFKIDFIKRSKGLRGDNEHFLFDIDRNDVRLRNLNFFLSRLRGPAKNIQEAYDLLKPQEVIDAERFMKNPCERQGEWFFIPVPGRHRRRTEKTRWDGRKRLGRPPFVQATLQAKGNRAHFVQFLSEGGFVTGKVSHGGHEHKPIVLKGWHKPVPNTAVESFKITGAVD